MKYFLKVSVALLCDHLYVAAKVRFTLARSNTVVLRGTINQEFGLTLFWPISKLK